MLDEPEDRARRSGLATQVRSVISRWKTILNSRAKSSTQHTYPIGKLGEIIHCLEASDAASLHDLTTLTGWKQATVRGALSRLRARGFPIRRKIRDGTALYHLERR
jgi:hypothetical protein